MAHSLFKRSPQADSPATVSSGGPIAGDDVRRAAMGASLLGMASMIAVALYQIGAVRHLPDPPVDGFDADYVNDPERATIWGVPDGFCKLTAHALMLGLTRAVTAEDARRQPWLPLFAAGFALGQAIVAVRGLRRTSERDGAWCGYRLADAAAHVATALLLLPAALRTLCRRMRCRFGGDPSARA